MLQSAVCRTQDCYFTLCDVIYKHFHLLMEEEAELAWHPTQPYKQLWTYTTCMFINRLC